MTVKDATDRWVSVERQGDGVRMHCHRCDLVEILVVDLRTLRTVVAEFLNGHPEACRPLR